MIKQMRDKRFFLHSSCSYAVFVILWKFSEIQGTTTMKKKKEREREEIIVLRKKAYTSHKTNVN